MDFGYLSLVTPIPFQLKSSFGQREVHMLIYAFVLAPVSFIICISQINSLNKHN